MMNCLHQFLRLAHIEGYNLTYNDEEFKQKSVTFAFRNYRPLPTNDPGLPFLGL